MNAVIYARFSSQNQTEQSIKEQIKVCEGYAKEKGYTITDTYIDTNSREQFEQMIKDSSQKKFQAVIVYSRDRFLRDVQEVILRDILKENGVQLILANENLKNDPSEILLQTVIKSVIMHYKKELEEKAKQKERISNEG